MINKRAHCWHITCELLTEGGEWRPQESKSMPRAQAFRELDRLQRAGARNVILHGPTADPEVGPKPIPDPESEILRKEISRLQAEVRMLRTRLVEDDHHATQARMLHRLLDAREIKRHDAEDPVLRLACRVESWGLASLAKPLLTALPRAGECSVWCEVDCEGNERHDKECRR